MKPASYPFLAIARKYGLDYGDVLIYSDIHYNGNVSNTTEWACRAVDHVSAIEPDYAAVQDILNALEQFRAIQAGLIDWNTGEQTLKGFQSIGRGMRDVPKPGVIVDYAADLDLMRPLRTPLLDPETLKPIPGTGGVDLGELPIGALNYALFDKSLDDGTNDMSNREPDKSYGMCSWWPEGCDCEFQCRGESAMNEKAVDLAKQRKK